jgi:hypothetical protein
LATGAALMLPAIAAMTTVRSSDFDWARVAAVARAHTNLTPEQHAAIVREMRGARHPIWKALPVAARLEHRREWQPG